MLMMMMPFCAVAEKAAKDSVCTLWLWGGPAWWSLFENGAYFSVLVYGHLLSSTLTSWHLHIACMVWYGKCRFI